LEFSFQMVLINPIDNGSCGIAAPAIFTTHLSLSAHFPIEFICADTHICAHEALQPQARQATTCRLPEERTMSLVTYRIFIKSKASSCAGQTGWPEAAGVIAMFAAVGRWCVSIFDAIAEARVQKAMIAAELYLNRYKHASKNDDDLPVLR
jgi:hypothetical protein